MHGIWYYDIKQELVVTRSQIAEILIAFPDLRRILTQISAPQPEIKTRIRF